MNKSKVTVPHNYTEFENPSNSDYQAAADLKPDQLYADEMVVWDRIVPLLSMLGRLQPWYMDTLIEYCRTVSNLTRLSAFIRQHGETYTIEGRNGEQIKNRPEVGQRNEERRLLRSYVTEFGLSPAAEKRLDAVQSDLFDNPFDSIAKRANAKQ